jgi:phage FluMu protein Com
MRLLWCLLFHRRKRMIGGCEGDEFIETFCPRCQTVIQYH